MSRIPELRSLRALKMSRNCLQVVVEDVGTKMKLLKILDLSHNKLWYLPSSVDRMTQLTFVDLSSNRFDQTPSCIFELRRLRHLDLSSNQLTSFSGIWRGPRQLRHLDLSRNRIADFPRVISTITGLTKLLLAHNRLGKLCADNSRLVKLSEIDVSGNSSHVIDNLFAPKNLEKLNIQQNSLEYLSVAHLKQLKHLNVDDNKLQRVPYNLYGCKKLITLKMANNKLGEINEDIGKLRKLRVLDISGNLLTSLPLQTIHDIPGLVTLDCHANKFTKTKTPRKSSKKSRSLNQTNRSISQKTSAAIRDNSLQFTTTSQTTSHTPQQSAAAPPPAPPLTHASAARTQRTPHTPHAARGHPHRRPVNQSMVGVRSLAIATTESTIGDSPPNQIFDHVINPGNFRYADSNHFSQMPGFDMNRSPSASESMKSQDTSYNGHDYDYNSVDSTNGCYSLSDSSNASDLNLRDSTRRGYPMARHNNYDTIKSTKVEYESDTPSLGSETFHYQPITVKDEKLVGICINLEKLLQNDLMKPLSNSRQVAQKDGPALLINSDSSIGNCEIFRVSTEGGKFSSKHEPDVYVYIPRYSLKSQIMLTIQVERIEEEQLASAQARNNLLNNIVSIGALVHVTSSADLDNKTVCMRLPCPPVPRGQGHLHLVDLRSDQVTPCSDSFSFTERATITVQSHRFFGKATLITRSRCKFKAASSLMLLFREIKDQK